MTQSEVRQMFIRANPGIRLEGYSGYWYRCANCGKWCGRPGRGGSPIPDDMKMEVDHIIPWSKSHCDALSNLQPLCKPCNRGKIANQSGYETAKSIIQSTVSGDLPNLLGGMAVAKIEKKLGIKRKRR